MASKAAGHLRAGSERQSHKSRVPVSRRSRGPAIAPLQRCEQPTGTPAAQPAPTLAVRPACRFAFVPTREWQLDARHPVQRCGCRGCKSGRCCLGRGAAPCASITASMPWPGLLSARASRAEVGAASPPLQARKRPRWHGCACCVGNAVHGVTAPRKKRRQCRSLAATNCARSYGKAL